MGTVVKFKLRAADRRQSSMPKQERRLILDKIVAISKEPGAYHDMYDGVYVTAEAVASAFKQQLLQKEIPKLIRGYMSRPIRAEANGDLKYFQELLPNMEIVPLCDYHLKKFYGKNLFPKDDHDKRLCINSSGGNGAAVLICKDDHPLYQFYFFEQTKRSAQYRAHSVRKLKKLLASGAIDQAKYNEQMLMLEGHHQVKPPILPPE